MKKFKEKFTFTALSEYYLGITMNGISKGSTVEIIWKMYNITSEETMCVGDALNDLSMLDYAKYGVAMGNASDIVKQNHIVTDSVYENGVANIIKKYCLNWIINS